MRLARLPYIVTRRSAQKWVTGPASCQRATTIPTPAAPAAVAVEHRRHQHHYGAPLPSFLDNTRILDRIYHQHDNFAERHLGPRADDIEEMLHVIGADTLDEMVELTVPDGIKLNRDLEMDPAQGETEMLTKLKTMASKNKVFRSYIGLGYNSCHIPLPIVRNMLENPGWITQYTPYQAELSQGRLTGLLNYQTMVTDLTGLDIANASLLDEGTAAAEAMGLSKRHTKRSVFYVDEKCHPHTIAVVKTRADICQDCKL